MIIYGKTVQRTEAIGDLINCPVWYSAVADVQGKQRIMNDWIRDREVIAATNAFGVGLDIADVRAVIHAGLPRRLRDYHGGCEIAHRRAGKQDETAKQARQLSYVPG